MTGLEWVCPYQDHPEHDPNACLHCATDEQLGGVSDWEGPAVDVKAMIEAADERRRVARARKDGGR